MTAKSGNGISAAYTGGSKTAAGITHIALKSLVTPLVEYKIRGVDATEIIPQHNSRRNFVRSATRHSVRYASRHITARAIVGGVATYQRSTGGRRHQCHCLAATPDVRRLVRDEASIIHRSVCDTGACALVAAHRK
jgi:hypothetical protein